MALPAILRQLSSKYGIFKYYLDRKNIYQTKKMLAIMVGNLCSQWGRSKYGSGKKVKNQWGKCDADIESIIISNLIFLFCIF